MITKWSTINHLPLRYVVYNPSKDTETYQDITSGIMYEVQRTEVDNLSWGTSRKEVNEW